VNYLGELAALGTSLTFAVNSVLFTAAGRKVGSVVVNRVRLILAFGFLAAAHLLFEGALFPAGAGNERWLWLGLSGVVGLVLGDAFLFQAFVWVGPRISMLMMSLAPIIAALTAWLLLGEALTALQILGVGLTIGGLIWVILENNTRQDPADRDYLKGILFGLGGAAGQAVGLVLAKRGLGGAFSPLSGNFIRMGTAMVIMWGYTLGRGQGRATVRSVTQDRRAFGFIAGGAFIGPFVGVSLSLLSLQYADVGVASTLMGLSPIFLLPISYLFLEERFGWGAVAGTVLALSGVALLFMV
jgi:drug/metabolite transporter (DMT)-like permease